MSRIILIGCGKTKRAEACAARDLYTGSLFRARRAYAESTGDTWRIVSARYGLVHPDTEVRPYNLTVDELCEPDRAAWALVTVASLLDEMPNETRLGDITLELHAGAAYAEPLIAVARSVGLTASWPVQGMGIGEQLGWYAKQRKHREARAA